MNWGEIKSLVAGNLGRETSDLSSLLPLWAQMFQKSAQRDRRYYFLRAKADRVVDATAQTYELPPGFKDELQVYIIESNPSGFTELYPVGDIEIVRRFRPGSASTDKDKPTNYQLGAQSIVFWPWPDASYTVRCEYWKDADAPDSTSADGFTNFWTDNYPDLYVAGMTKWGFARLQQYTDMEAWKKTELQILNDIRADHVARELRGDAMLSARQDVYGHSWIDRDGRSSSLI